jgi:hypothetical protein
VAGSPCDRHPARRDDLLMDSYFVEAPGPEGASGQHGMTGSVQPGSSGSQAKSISVVARFVAQNEVTETVPEERGETGDVHGLSR